MFFVVYNNDLHFLSFEYPYEFPRRKKMGQYINNITNATTKEMELGYESMNPSAFYKYRKEQFQKDVGVVQ